MDRETLREALTESAAAIRALEEQADAIIDACGRVVSALRNGGKILTAGNGGSAAEALHMAEELVGRFRNDRPSLPGIALVADSTALTCIGNDYGFDAAFSRQIEGLGQAGDVLVLFSTSGQAPNLSRAATAARDRAMTVIAFLGRDGGALRGFADCEVVVRGQATERIQEAHQVLLHIVLDAVEREFAETEK